MRRLDQLTYDTDPRPVHRSGPGGPSRPLIALLVIVLVLAAVLVLWAMQSPGRSSSLPAYSGSAASPGSTVPATSAAASTNDRPTVRPLGMDASTTAQAPDGSRAAAAGFVAAWLEHDPKVRKAALQATAAPGLAEQLELTSAGNIPPGRPTGPPVLQQGSAYRVQFVQSLTSGIKVRVYLVSDPQARYGWVATSVEKV